VSRQVIPELTRMSTLGEGVHRLTMTLRPEALGEVRVTMTVRDGSLHVRLAAGTEAQHALVPDLTELQQVLKLGSGSDVRVVLRDLSGVPANPDQQSTQTGNQAGNQTGGQHGAGQHAGHGAPTGDPGTSAGSGQNRREAGTPRDINATDGVVDETSGSRSQAVRRARPTGVDLTM
jgi:flagellar hook-length control protein FliK